MKLIKEQPDTINNLKELTNFLRGPELDMKAPNGNGDAKAVGTNLKISDPYFYGGDKALAVLVKNWTASDGYMAKWFREDYGITFTLVSRDIDQGGKDGGTVSIVVKPTFSKKESTSYEKDLDDNKPIIVKGVKGMKSVPFTKKFKNMAAYDKWTDSDDFGNYEVNQIMNESSNNLKREALKLLDEATNEANSQEPARINKWKTVTYSIWVDNKIVKSKLHIHIAKIEAAAIKKNLPNADVKVVADLAEAVGLVDISGWSDRDLKRANHADDLEEFDFRKATYSVYIGKRMVKGGLLGPRAAAYAAAIRKNKPDANVLVIMDI